MQDMELHGVLLGAAQNAWLISKDYTENRIMFKKPLSCQPTYSKEISHNAN